MVNLQQSKSGTQCGAYGRWTGPFNLQSDHKLLHTIASQPVIVQLHQLADSDHLPANTKSHAQINFFFEKNTTKPMTFSKWPTGWHQTVCDNITNFVNSKHSVLEEDSAQIPSWDIVTSGSAIHTIPWGNDENEKTSEDIWGRPHSILWRPGHLMREVISDTTRVGSKICVEEICSCGEHICEHFCGARGTELFQCLGHRTFMVPGAWNFCGVRCYMIICFKNSSPLLQSISLQQVLVFPLHINRFSCFWMAMASLSPRARMYFNYSINVVL